MPPAGCSSPACSTTSSAQHHRQVRRRQENAGRDGGVAAGDRDTRLGRLAGRFFGAVGDAGGTGQGHRGRGCWAPRRAASPTTPARCSAAPAIRKTTSSRSTTATLPPGVFSARTTARSAAATATSCSAPGGRMAVAWPPCAPRRRSFDELAQRKALQAELDEIRVVRSRLRGLVNEWLAAAETVARRRRHESRQPGHDEIGEGAGPPGCPYACQQGPAAAAARPTRKGLPAEVETALASRPGSKSRPYRSKSSMR